MSAPDSGFDLAWPTAHIDGQSGRAKTRTFPQRNAEARNKKSKVRAKTRQLFAAFCGASAGQAYEDPAGLALTGPFVAVGTIGSTADSAGALRPVLYHPLWRASADAPRSCVYC
eukprot:211357-Prorocentrum_minimum.AAC.1